MHLSLEKGQTLCERGDVGRGMLWLARALQLVPEEDAPHQRAVRANLAAWHGRPHPLRNILAHSGPVHAVAFSQDGGTVATGSNRTVRLWKAATGELTGRNHLAFQAQSREVVNAFYKAALENGGKDNGAPGERAYHPGYYAAFVFDPDGNNIEAVYHGEGQRSAPSVRVTF